MRSRLCVLETAANFCVRWLRSDSLWSLVFCVWLPVGQWNWTKQRRNLVLPAHRSIEDWVLLADESKGLSAQTWRWILWPLGLNSNHYLPNAQTKLLHTVSCLFWCSRVSARAAHWCLPYVWDCCCALHDPERQWFPIDKWVNLFSCAQRTTPNEWSVQETVDLSWSWRMTPFVCSLTRHMLPFHVRQKRQNAANPLSFWNRDSLMWIPLAELELKSTGTDKIVQELFMQRQSKEIIPKKCHIREGELDEALVSVLFTQHCFIRYSWKQTSASLFRLKKNFKSILKCIYAP